MKSCFLGLLAACLVLPTLALAAGPTSHKHITPDHPALVYQGRLDPQQVQQPQLVWQGTQISTEIDSGYLALGFTDLQGQAYFDLVLDGNARLLTPLDGWITIPIEPGKHQLQLLKRSEAHAGSARFLGLKLSPQARIQAPLASSGQPRFIFYGDSITVGANNEDGEVDQWEDRSTHNNGLSYAALVARHFGAEYQNLAVSGMGIVTGYVDFTVSQIWDRYTPDPKAPRAPVSEWRPDLVFLNFGENDVSFTSRHQAPFPENFVEEYIAQVERMRQAYPDSTFILLRGGMAGGGSDERLIRPWEQVVATLKQRDHKLHAYAFQHWTGHHPRVSDHRKMAAELIGWLTDSNLVPSKTAP